MSGDNQSEIGYNIESVAQEYLNQLEAIQMPYEDKEMIKYYIQASLEEVNSKEGLKPAVIGTAIDKVKESMVFGIAVADFMSSANRMIMELEALMS
ncbi:MAG: hypothetical protein NTV45_04055 [Firmicutes bacterium]|nr:hypothetical protein [Bacillota bacterium]